MNIKAINRENRGTPYLYWVDGMEGQEVKQLLFCRFCHKNAFQIKMTWVPHGKGDNIRAVHNDEKCLFIARMLGEDWRDEYDTF